MNISILQYLNHLLKGTDINLFTIKRGATTINIKRSYEQIINEKRKKSRRSEVQAEEQVKEEIIPAVKAELKEEKLTTLKSNTVGVFYRGKAKIGAPIVKVNSEVKKGQQLGIIDCMGVIEKVTANTTGVIKEILTENHKPVEYGQPLFIIETK